MGVYFESVWYKRIWDDSYFKDNFGKIHLIFSHTIIIKHVGWKLGYTKWHHQEMRYTELISNTGDEYIFLRFVYGPFLKSLLNFLQHCICFSFWFFSQEICRISAPWPRIDLHPLQLEKVLTAGLPGKSLQMIILKEKKRKLSVFPISRIFKSENLNLNWYTKIHAPLFYKRMKFTYNMMFIWCALDLLIFRKLWNITLVKSFFLKWHVYILFNRSTYLTICFDNKMRKCF